MFGPTATTASTARDWMSCLRNSISEELDPEVVGVVGARQSKGEAAARADGVLQPVLVHGVDVERRIGEGEVEGAHRLVRIVVVAVDLAAVADVALQPVHGKIHTAKAPGLVG